MWILWTYLMNMFLCSIHETIIGVTQVKCKKGKRAIRQNNDNYIKDILLQIKVLHDAIEHWSQTQFLEGHSSAQFCSNPNQTHLIQIIKVFSIPRNFQAGVIWSWLKLNSAELWLSGSWVWDHCHRRTFLSKWFIKNLYHLKTLSVSQKFICGKRRFFRFKKGKKEIVL